MYILRVDFKELERKPRISQIVWTSNWMKEKRLIDKI
jgi:hypothetical protein